MFGFNKQLESKEFRQLNADLLSLEKKIILLEATINSIDMRLKSLQGRFYQNKTNDLEEEVKKEDSNTKTYLIPV